MSLIDEAMENYKIMNKTKVDDGYGGLKNVWSEGTEFKGAMVFDTSVQMTIARQSSVMSAYTLTTSKNIVLEYHDVIKRIRDSKIFRITSDGDDKYSPQSSTLDMRQVKAEEWELVDLNG